MELFCTEPHFEPKSPFDSAIVDDDRILRNLVITEERYLITGSYFKCLQTDLKPHMRDVVANWMLEVCEEEQCQNEVFPLAMNMLDRFLAVVKIRKNQLQLLGSVCLLIATKLRQSRPLDPRSLIRYTDWSVTFDEIIGWELLVLSRLKWDVAAVTPNDFIGPLLRRLSKQPLISEQRNRIEKHVFTLIDLCSVDFNFSMLPSSMIAAASIITAVDGMLTMTDNKYILKSISSQVLYQLHEITGIEKELLRECHQQIEQKIKMHLRPVTNPGGYCGKGTDSNNNHSSNGGKRDVDSPIDCPKENYNSAIINTSTGPEPANCGLHPNVFKHATCVPNDSSIGVKF